MASSQFDLNRTQQELAGGNRDVKIENGQVLVWQPTNVPQDAYSYQNVDPMTGQPRQFDPNGPTWGPGEGPGTWVPASYEHPNGQLGSLLGKMALYTSGGEFALGAAGLGGAAAGASAAGGGAGAAAPTMTGLVAPGALDTGLTTIGAGGLTAGGVGAGVGAATAGAAGATAPTMAGVVAPGTLSTGVPSASLAAPTAHVAGALTTKEAIGAGSRALSNMAQASAQNRGVTDQNNLVRDQVAAQIANSQATNGINREAALETAQSDAYKKALLAALAQNMGDFHIDTSQFKGKIPQIEISGGPRPSAIGDQGKAAANVLYNQAVQKLLADPNTLIPAYQAPTLAPPTKEGVTEKIAGPASLGLQLLSEYYGGK